MIVIGIEHLNNGLCQVFLLHCLLVITPVKGVQIKGIDGLCIPDAQGIYHVISVADHRQVIGHCANGLVALLNKVVDSIPVFNANITTEFNLYCIFRPADLKWIPIL